MAQDKAHNSKPAAQAAAGPAQAQACWPALPSCWSAPGLFPFPGPHDKPAHHLLFLFLSFRMKPLPRTAPMPFCTGHACWQGSHVLCSPAKLRLMPCSPSGQQTANFNHPSTIGSFSRQEKGKHGSQLGPLSLHANFPL